MTDCRRVVVYGAIAIGAAIFSYLFIFACTVLSADAANACIKPHCLGGLLLVTSIIWSVVVAVSIVAAALIWCLVRCLKIEQCCN